MDVENIKQKAAMLRERVEALLQGYRSERVPLYPFLLGFCARNVGYPISSIYTDPVKSFMAQLWTFEQYGFDGVPEFGYASYGGWEFGGEVKFPNSEWEQAPMHGRFAVQSEEDVEKLKLPNVKTDGMLPMAMEFSKLQDKFGMPISIVLGGNFTIAGNICPVEKLCRWMIKKPELAHRILRLATDHIIEVVQYWVDTFGAERVMPKIWEPLAANSILSPKQFEKFVLPYVIETNKKILAMGIKHIFYHICGEQNLNLPYWAQVPMGNPGIVSVGHQVNLTRAIEYFGNTCIIAGNVEPAIIQSGPPQKVYELCRECIGKGKYAPRGFMLMPGCEIPPMSPPYNVYMMRKAVEDFGRYNR
ncbi:uroporphyrinogen decarboxylase family protein [Candidatus Aerophobetes bacterium]|nr:uroporphyrinogen decarboxylase family protein [Candidatus Aerophobetes bacterium]